MARRKPKTEHAKSPPDTAQTGRPWLVAAAMAALLAWYFVSAVSAVAGKSTTFDELFHLTAGYSYWKFGDFRLQPENGNLPQRWAAIPLLFSEPTFPSREQDAWRLSAVSAIGEQFFYGFGNNADRMLLRGRAMIALFGVALGALIFFWMRRLLGLPAAFLSLALYAFCPTVLSNGALVTSDMVAAFFFVASTCCIWLVLHRVNWRTLLLSALVMGGLFVAKFSAVMIIPMGLLLMGLQLASRQPTVVEWRERAWDIAPRLRRLPVQLLTIAAHVLVVWIVIWTFYNFRFSMFATEPTAVAAEGQTVAAAQPQFAWDVILSEPDTLDRVIIQMRDHRVLPEGYLYGLAYTLKFAKQRSAFFNGEYGTTGWRMFFPYCVLVKTPLTLFVLMLLGGAALLRGWHTAGDSWRSRAVAARDSLYRTAPAWVLFVVYWAFAIPSHLNIGHRHILPTYPAMLMLAGASSLWLVRRDAAPASDVRRQGNRDERLSAIRRYFAERRWPVLACVVLGCTAFFAAESLWRRPNYLAYFNQIVGGPAHGYRHLVDSSLDWGQDLPALKKWLVDEGLNDSIVEKTYLSYFGTGSPEYYRINATLLPCFFPRTTPRVPEPWQAGTYCISATMLQNVYTPFAGPWNSRYETAYQELIQIVRGLVEVDAESRNRLLAEKGEPYWAEAFTMYEQGRLARLNSFLKQREPDTEINYSILVYRLTDADLKQALEGPPVELVDPSDAPGDGAEEQRSKLNK